ncbi:polynucleotide adenylyltransferase PcnB [Lampropedia puyangensis]|uniref:Poly(A) polymerase I n=1 Tax=Lampropedia puyangensis TaxID=1330072 RepID=A0A4S8FDQ7_9BURK|nr:polynucleotide adenylyltransferase PcnB [Lampropedia puyangensis]THU05389.1 polynucleotide adenylyltransferase PcnB [Lampropedia puyangensis]
MIKQFIDKLLGKRGKKAPIQENQAPVTPRTKPRKTAALNTKTFGKRHEVPVSVHGIDPDFVDRRAIDVVKTLQDKGYEAYIVGGAVRDLLLGLKPKDFDVATNATPEQVKSLFRRAFIIGRRFRIVHVVFGRGRENEVIEVTTFRAYLDNQAAEKISGNEKTSRQALAGVQHAVDESGRVLRDNVWGSMQEDAARRDFSINAMYYDPRSQIVVDYHHGIEDAQKHMIRMIGDPVARYREDPVRMLRAIRFSAKLNRLGFKLGTKTAQPLTELRPLLEDIPPSRMFDEMLKLLQTGHAVASIAQLQALHLDKGIYPLLDLIVERADWPLVALALQDTDRRVAEGKSVAPSFLLACVLWDDVQRVWEREQARGEHPNPALSNAINEVFDRRVGDVSGRGKLAADIREIWMLQPRFERRTGKAPISMVEQPRFRAGLDFLRLRGRSGETIAELAQWWETFSLAHDEERADMLEHARQQAQQSCKTNPARKQKKPRKPKTDALNTAQELDEHSSKSADSIVPDVGSDALQSNTAPAKKRRRRRKKPAAGTGDDLNANTPTDQE